jgi:hypothetical protein
VELEVTASVVTPRQSCLFPRTFILMTLSTERRTSFRRDLTASCIIMNTLVVGDAQQVAAKGSLCNEYFPFGDLVLDSPLPLVYLVW